MTPYTYPKSQHNRTQLPGPYRDYRSYKPFLQREFARACVYCRQPDTVLPNLVFGVDHYRPKSLFASLATDYTNLYYCCNSCNSNKSSYWPLPALVATEFIPNPCDHRMFEHMRYRGGVVEGRTRAGNVAVERLDLNDPAAVASREFVLRMIEMLESQRVKIEGDLVAVSRAFAAGKISTATARVHRDELNELLRHNAGDQSRLRGTAPIA